MELVFRYIDGIVIVLCVAVAFMYTLHLIYRAVFTIRKLPLFFVLLGAMVIFISMVAHLFEISYRAILRALDGNFVYDYRFYSLMLMGIVLLLLSAYLVSQVKAYVLGNSQGKKNFVKAACLIVLLSAPTFPFAPIGLLPTLACVTALAALAFVVKNPQADPQIPDKIHEKNWTSQNHFDFRRSYF